MNKVEELPIAQDPKQAPSNVEEKVSTDDTHLLAYSDESPDLDRENALKEYV